MQELEHAYRVLELEPGASVEEINQAYKDLVFIWHPDRLPKDNVRLIEKAQEKIKQLNQARDYLRSHTQPSSTANAGTSYRYRSRTYARPAANTRYRRDTKDRATETATHSTRYSSSSAAQSRYSRTAYGTYGRYANTHGSAYDAQSSRSEQAGPEGSATAKGDRHQPYQKPAKDTQPTPHSAPTRETSTFYTSSVDSNRNDGWNNYTTNATGTGGYPSSYRHSSRPNGNYSGRSANGSSETTREPSRTTSADRSPASSDSAAQGYPASRPRQQNPDLSGANFQGANLREKDFSRRNLSSANLREADLQDTFLHGVNLNRADLTNANLFRANLLQANLSHANLRGANLIGADLSGADLSGADLSGAKVSVGDRVMVKLTGTILRGTIMPDGTINA